MNKLIISIIVIVILFAVIGIGGYFVYQRLILPQPPIGKCGDGICDTNEKANPNLCPKDCQRETITQPSPITTTPTPTPEPPSEQPKGDGVIYLTLITHIERPTKDPGPWVYTNDDALLKEHAKLLDEVAKVFEKYGAKLTVEASTSMANGILKFGGKYGKNNILLDLQNRGHGIGAHMDLGIDSPASQAAGKAIAGVTYNELVGQMKEQISALNSVLDSPVIHNSGTPSPLNWVGASIEAGMKCHTSAVTYYLVSVPEKDRSAGWTDKYILAGNYHQTFPFDIADRVEPWRMESGENWFENNANGKLVYIPGDSGVHLGHLYDYYTLGIKDHRTLLKTATFTKEDVDEALKILEEAMTYTDKDKLNTFYFMIVLKDMSEDRENNYELLEYFFSEVKKYVDQGKIKWKSIPEICEEYLGKG